MPCYMYHKYKDVPLCPAIYDTKNHREHCNFVLTYFAHEPENESSPNRESQAEHDT